MVAKESTVKNKMVAKESTVKNKKKVVIIGAGIAGLAAGYYFSQNPEYEVFVVERQDYVGGLARGFDYKGFHFDFGPHKIYTILQGILEEMDKVTPLLKVKKKNRIYLRNNYFEFPLKMSQIMTKMPVIAARAMLDIAGKLISRRPDDSYENYLTNRFGRTLYNLSFKGYAEKVWNTEAGNLDRELAIRRVAVSNIFQLIKGAVFGDSSKFSAQFFHYPPHGMKQIAEDLVKNIEKNGGQVLLETEISEINVTDKKINYVKIKKVKLKPDYVISTIYLDYLLGIVKDNGSEYSRAREATLNLTYRPVSIIYIILNKERAMEDCWVFFPEKEFLFQRVSEQKAFSKLTCPPGKTGLMVETTKEPTKENIDLIFKQLEEAGILKSRKEIQEYIVKTGPRVYPVYLRGFLEPLNAVLNYCDSIKGLYTIGRPGRFNYNNTDHSWDMALRTYEHIISGENPENWNKLKERFDSYRIVD